MGHRAGGQGRLEALQLFEKGLGLLQVRLDAGLQLRTAGPPDVVLELLDLLGESHELGFDVWYATHADIWRGQVVPGTLGGDNFQVGRGGRIDLIALPMIPMKMGIDELTD